MNWTPSILQLHIDRKLYKSDGVPIRYYRDYAGKWMVRELAGRVIIDDNQSAVELCGWLNFVGATVTEPLAIRSATVPDDSIEHRCTACDVVIEPGETAYWFDAVGHCDLDDPEYCSAECLRKATGR